MAGSATGRFIQPFFSTVYYRLSPPLPRRGTVHVCNSTSSYSVSLSACEAHRPWTYSCKVAGYAKTVGDAVSTLAAAASSVGVEVWVGRSKGRGMRRRGKVLEGVSQELAQELSDF